MMPERPAIKSGGVIFSRANLALSGYYYPDSTIRTIALIYSNWGTGLATLPALSPDAAFDAEQNAKNILARK